MNTSDPHDLISSLEEGDPLKEYVELSEEEFKELEPKTTKERAAWLRETFRREINKTSAFKRRIFPGRGGSR